MQQNPQTKQIKHTPGPWKIDNHISVVANISNHPIATTYPHTYLSSAESYNTMKANARLIAAAPELLEACHKIDVYLQGIQTGKKFEEADLVTMIQLAIAKAEGK